MLAAIVALCVFGFVLIVGGGHLSERGQTSGEQAAGLFTLVIGFCLGLTGLGLLLIRILCGFEDA